MGRSHPPKRVVPQAHCLFMYQKKRPYCFSNSLVPQTMELLLYALPNGWCHHLRICSHASSCLIRVNKRRIDKACVAPYYQNCMANLWVQRFHPLHRQVDIQRQLGEHMESLVWMYCDISSTKVTPYLGGGKFNIFLRSCIMTNILSSSFSYVTQKCPPLIVALLIQSRLAEAKLILLSLLYTTDSYWVIKPKHATNSFHHYHNPELKGTPFIA